jgi:hypothetical protein
MSKYPPGVYLVRTNKAEAQDALNFLKGQNKDAWSKYHVVRINRGGHWTYAVKKK